MQGLSTHVIEVQPQPLTEALLTRVSELTQEAAKQLLALFTAQSLVDSSGLLVEDPRSTQWRAVVQQSGLSGEQQPCGGSSLDYLHCSPCESTAACLAKLCAQLVLCFAYGRIRQSLCLAMTRHDHVLWP